MKFALLVFEPHIMEKSVEISSDNLPYPLSERDPSKVLVGTLFSR